MAALCRSAFQALHTLRMPASAYTLVTKADVQHMIRGRFFGRLSCSIGGIMDYEYHRTRREHFRFRKVEEGHTFSIFLSVSQNIVEFP